MRCTIRGAIPAKPKGGTPTRLTAAAFLASSAEGLDNQIAAARWEFIKAVKKMVPARFDQLREGVYPKYAGLANGKPDYWNRGWRFDTWQVHSDHKEADPPSAPESS